MRTRQAFKNAVMGVLLELAVALSGIVIPRFFTALYGSSVNGLVASINQFISYMGLVEAGVSAAGTVALYQPLARGDRREVSGVVAAAKRFYLRSGFLFLLLDAALVLAYPFAVKNEITDVSFIRTMILILSVNGIVDYFILGKYRMLLTADQRLYIISFFQILGIVVTTGVSLLLIRMEVSALLVKGSAAAVYILRTAAVILYVRRHYPWLDLREKPLTGKFTQRNAALFHQIVGMICNNTDIILLTLLLPVKALSEVSVYSLYYLVMNGLYSILFSVSNGLSASFGQVISTGEREVLKKSFSTYELTMFLLSFLIYTCMGGLMLGFVGLYSADFPDRALYLRPILAVLFVLAGLIMSLRLPGLTLIMAAGHYRETKWRAAIEAGINLTVSVALIFRWGIVGVLLGTCASYLYRCTDTILYCARRFVPGSGGRTAARLGRNFLTGGGLVWLGSLVIPGEMNGWFSWLLWAAGFGIVSAVVFAGVNAAFEPREAKECLRRLLGVFGKGKIGNA